MFYPIISSPPCFDPHTGLYDVTVVIVSRWEDDARTSRQLQDCLDGACFLVQGWQYKSITPLEVLVTLSSPGESLHIELQLRDGRRHHISGLPRSIEKVLSDQYKPEVDMPRWKITGRKRRSAGPASSPQERRNTKRARGCHLPSPSSPPESLSAGSRWKGDHVQIDRHTRNIHKVKRLDIPGTDAISDVGSQVAEGAHNVAEHAPTQVQSAIKTAENAVKTAESVAQDVLDKVNATMGFSLGTRHVCMGSGDQSTWSCNHTLPFDSSFLKEEVVKALQSRLGLFLTVAQYITAGCIKAFLWTGVCLIFVADSLLLLTLVKGGHNVGRSV
ncbi:hypothetical protein OAory_01095810 [Aspergillus oryzae]|uniref:Uncharacterized protein n=1 Tax=Aspergillus oryzae TaxID=5062 RepID=A0A1S9D4F9_ASPOZ|nr:hypothetical protein OAory_01095810 [Aspergillus oryzae]